MSWKGWDAPVRGGDGARQEDPPVTLFVNQGVKARRERQRRLADSTPRKARQTKAVLRQRARAVTREMEAGRPFKPWWR